MTRRSRGRQDSRRAACWGQPDSAIGAFPRAKCCLRDEPLELNIGSELELVGEPGLSLRTASTNFVFVALLGLVAILARAVALTTRGPWFSPDVSIQVYSVTMLGSALLALALVAFASFRAAHLDEVLLSLEIRTSVLAQVTGIDLQTSEEEPRTSVRAETIRVDDVLEGLDTSADGVPTMQLSRDEVVQVPEVSVPVSPRSLADVQRDTLSRYRTVQSARDRVWTSVLGPLIASLALQAAAAILPGAAGLAQTNFQLNTMLVLFLAYGWLLLLWWAIASLVMLPSASRQRKVFRPRLWEKLE